MDVSLFSLGSLSSKTSAVRCFLLDISFLSCYQCNENLIEDLNFLFLAPTTDRIVVVRETDGTLRNSTWDEKMRMCQTFFPRQGRECFLPRMFQPEFLMRALEHVSATYLLDSACAQLEPDDPDYIRVVHAVYDDVDRKGTYDELYSTRLFGGLVFYLACVARVDGLMLDRLMRGRLADAADVVRLVNMLHPKCNCAVAAGRSKEPLTNRGLIESYIETMARDVVVSKLRSALGSVDGDPGTDDVAVSQ